MATMTMPMMDWRDLFERAQVDVALVTAMMKEAAIRRLTLDVGWSMFNSRLACEGAGRVLWTTWRS